ncbi:MAG: ABC transporter ATP-binding protein/permease [Hyphomonadaceae bacterium]|nr:ABC transporter ATP-binding protein/permease [Hyphomonadaceae bacterium]
MRTSCSTQKPVITITSKMDATPKKPGSLFRLFRTYFRPHLGWFLGGTLFAVTTALFANAYAAILAFVGNGIQGAIENPDGSTNWVWWAAGGIVALATGRAVSLYLMTILNNTGVQRALVDIQQTQFDELIDGDFARLSGDASGGFVSRFINDVNAIRDAGLRFANNFTKSVVTVLGAFGIMLWLDWQLTLILLVVYPIAFWPVIALGERVRKRAKRAQRQVGDVTALLSEGFQSHRIIKAYGLETYQKDRAKLGFIERSRLFLKVLTDKAAVDPILEVTGGVALAGILGFSAWRIASGDSSLGALLGIIGAIGIAAPELRALGTLNAVAQEGGAAADRVFEVVDALPAVADAPDAATLDHAKGEIKFRDVVFNYPDGTPALRGLDFAVAAGETVAFVGSSGAGKSTIFNLILRLYDVSAGEIRIDGHDVQSLNAGSLRRASAIVSQDTALFDDTVRANIALGRLDATDADIELAAKAANAHDFIRDLPGGYAAEAGEMGRNLSGGQRQRIALARAILRDAPILMLDEATSALDAESEAKVQAALAEFSQDRTTLIIAHRLSTVRAADRIIVVDEGRVVETGTHDELIEANGVYKKLVELQLN